MIFNNISDVMMPLMIFNKISDVMMTSFVTEKSNWKHLPSLICHFQLFKTPFHLKLVQIEGIFDRKLNLSIKGCPGSKNISKIPKKLTEINIDENLTQHLLFDHMKLMFFF